MSDRRLAIDREYLLTFAGGSKGIGVKGVAVHSTITDAEENTGGESTARYAARIRFDAGQAEKIAYLLDSAEGDRDLDAPLEADRRCHVRFRMTIPLESILSHTAQFMVKTMSLGGMLIQSEQSLETNSMIPVELFLPAGRGATFTGRVASCTMTSGNGQACYDIGVEFVDSDRGRSLLKSFIGSLSAAKDVAAGETASDRIP